MLVFSICHEQEDDKDHERWENISLHDFLLHGKIKEKHTH